MKYTPLEGKDYTWDISGKKTASWVIICYLPPAKIHGVGLGDVSPPKKTWNFGGETVFFLCDESWEKMKVQNNLHMSYVIFFISGVAWSTLKSCKPGLLSRKNVSFDIILQTSRILTFLWKHRNL